jgi:CTD small phosphatase-like protein 2
LRVIKLENGQGIENMLLIDNSCLSYSLNLDNGIPILPFYDNLKDEEFLHLTYYLRCLLEKNKIF